MQLRLISNWSYKFFISELDSLLSNMVTKFSEHTVRCINMSHIDLITECLLKIQLIVQKLPDNGCAYRMLAGTNVTNRRFNGKLYKNTLLHQKKILNNVGELFRTHCIFYQCYEFQFNHTKRTKSQRR